MRVPLCLCLGAVLAACAVEPIEGMELRCQTEACICVERTGAFPRIPGQNTAEVLWRDNGDAYCPEGYVLRLDDKKT